jgi:hypothetical protein
MVSFFLRRPPRQRASRGTDPGPLRSRASITLDGAGVHHRAVRLHCRDRGKSRSTRIAYLRQFAKLFQDRLRRAACPLEPLVVIGTLESNSFLCR